MGGPKAWVKAIPNDLKMEGGHPVQARFGEPVPACCEPARPLREPPVHWLPFLRSPLESGALCHIHTGTCCHALDSVPVVLPFLPTFCFLPLGFSCAILACRLAHASTRSSHKTAVSGHQPVWLYPRVLAVAVPYCSFAWSIVLIWIAAGNYCAVRGGLTTVARNIVDYRNRRTSGREQFRTDVPGVICHHLM